MSTTAPPQTLGSDLWALPLQGDRKPVPITRTPFVEHAGQFSPDSRWIAYQSNESGVLQIYVQPFAGPAAKQMVSTTGGSQVRWRSDGKALFYLNLDDRLMEVPVRLDPRMQSVDVGTPVPLFKTRIGGALARGGNTQQYMVSRDGRFLMRVVGDTVTSAPITMILNWQTQAASRDEP